MNSTLALYALTVLTSILMSLSSLMAYGADTTGADVPLYRSGHREMDWHMGKKADGGYLSEVQPVLAARCVACHGCYEAPCQLNLQSYQSVRRGYHTESIYGLHLKAISGIWRVKKPAEMFVADSMMSRWRELGYHPVVNHDQEPEGDDQPANYNQSLMYRFVDAGQKNRPGFDLMSLDKLNSEMLDESAWQCVATEGQWDRGLKAQGEKVARFDDFMIQNPNAGMPFALPAVEPEKSQVLKDWLKAGAKGPSWEERTLARTPSQPKVIEAWESFLNQADNKSRLTARYIYEHTFSAKYVFEEMPSESFEIVRSRTRTGNIAEVISARPYDHPGEGKPMFYRLRKVTRVPVQKTQIIWHVSAARLEHLKEQFLNSNWGKGAIPAPSWVGNEANPFKNFARIPAKVRSKFMMENSSVIVGAMVQGSVCVGSRATYAIRDHFWGWFLNPDVDPSVQVPMLGLKEWDAFNTERNSWKPRTRTGRLLLSRIDKADLGKLSVAKDIARRIKKLVGFEEVDPQNEVGGQILMDLRKYRMSAVEMVNAVRHFLRSTNDNQAYQEAYEKQLRIVLKNQGRQGLRISDLWDGSGDSSYAGKVNPNAWLNITRHGRSATVQFGGKEGGRPQSIWILSYSNFERLYYNLVVSFKNWGNIPHKLATWRHMSYVRLEGEDLAISLIPIKYRDAVRQRFTRGMLGATLQKYFFPHWSLNEMWSGYRPKTHTGRFFKGADLPPRPAGDRKVASARNADEAIEMLVELGKERLGEAFERPGAARPLTDDETAWEADFAKLSGVKAKDGAPWAKFLPELSFVRITRDDAPASVYSIHLDRGYKAHNFSLAETQNRDPDHDMVSFYRGTVGAYPNAFFDIPSDKRAEFIADVRALDSDADGKELLRKWAVARNSGEFWPLFDWLHAWKSVERPENRVSEQGVLDLSQYLFFVNKL